MPSKGTLCSAEEVLPSHCLETVNKGTSLLVFGVLIIGIFSYGFVGNTVYQTEIVYNERQQGELVYYVLLSSVFNESPKD